MRTKTGYQPSSKYLVLCYSEERKSYRFGMTWGCVNDDRILIFGWTIIFSKNRENLSGEVILIRKYRSLKDHMFIRTGQQTGADFNEEYLARPGMCWQQSKTRTSVVFIPGLLATVSPSSESWEGRFSAFTVTTEAIRLLRNKVQFTYKATNIDQKAKQQMTDK